MSYNNAQLEATKAYILKFFHSEITRNKIEVIPNNMLALEKHLHRLLFRDLLYFKPDKFELKKHASSEPYFIEWISNNILPFPETFSVTLTSNGDSIASHEEKITIIFDPDIAMNNSSNISASTSAESMSICTPSPPCLEKENKYPNSSSSKEFIPAYSPSKPAPVLRITPKVKPNIQPESVKKLTFVSNVLEQAIIEKTQAENERERSEKEKIFYNSCYQGLYEYIKYTPKKSGKRNIIIHDTSHIDNNNIYGYLEKPKYDNKTGGMYIPIYKKNKYGDVYRTMRATVGTSEPTQKIELEKLQPECDNLMEMLNSFRIS